MTEQPLPDFDGGEPRGLRGALAGGLSPQAIAALLLIAALLAVLYLLLGGSGDTAGTAKVTATPTRAAAAARATGGASAAVSTVVNSAGTLPTAAVATGAGALPTTLAGVATQSLTPSSGGVSGASSGAAGSVATPATGAIDPTALAVGGFAKVSGTDGDGARLRFGFGLDTASIRWAVEGESLKILGGPEQSDGYTWYRVQDNLGNVGWVASDFLRAAAGGAWAPPLASPTVAPN
ncbi:MAG TPA: SH3 domain-containing protein [Anaerolineae bacterium]|nr:SH3 domain-containing protein [Ardenticatenia bacterium]MBK8541325.1 SH3 domain-containing protein [Ardenticatenia bacterium]HQZ71253.1 SH3 domain-containing protein [Anaerolineae bacterium]